MGYTLRRLLEMLPVLVGITLIAFLFMQLLPGDPIVILTGGKASPEVIADMRAKYGLDKPVYVQYLLFVRNASHGDLGTSIVQRTSVTQLVLGHMDPTLFLLCYGVFLSVLLTLPLSILSAMRVDRPVDHAVRVGGMFALSMPSFWVGLLLIFLFGLNLGWLPIAGWGEGFSEHLHYLFLPAVTLALFLTPILIPSLRAELLEIKEAEYIEAARAKGLKPMRIMVKHVLRNALIPTVTVLAVNIGWLVGGTVVIETVFSIPGLGQLLIQSVLYRDYPTIVGLTVVFGILVMVVNLLSDISYAAIDPRVEY
jgi:peptide/nickel transport system permease protein